MTVSYRGTPVQVGAESAYEQFERTLSAAFKTRAVESQQLEEMWNEFEVSLRMAHSCRLD